MSSFSGWKFRRPTAHRFPEFVADSDGAATGGSGTIADPIQPPSRESGFTIAKVFVNMMC
jgi:hypothetical protein